MADALKAEGNKAFAAKDFNLAVEKFSEAIALEPGNHVFYSNRSGAYASLKNYDKALEDANKTTELKPDWPKGWTRKGSCMHALGDLLGAHDAYEEALKLEPGNPQAGAGLEAVKRDIQAEATADGVTGDPTAGIGNVFRDPQLHQKLANNPKTSGYLADAAFMSKLERVGQDPKLVVEEMRDPRFLQVMSVLLGVDMSFGAPPESGSEGQPQKASEDAPMPDAPEPEPEDEETIAKKKAKEAADHEKSLGTENYKKRQFDAAIEHYSKAWEMHKDITYLTNLSAAKFEKGDYPGAIEACETAIAEGREMRADFKLIAKAFGRIGFAYEKMGDLPNAIANYHKALTEHRTPDILTKLRNAEKAQIKAEREAYINPEEAEKARELGNQRFKDADLPGAVEAFTEMTKRAPDDPRGYSNRAAALIKLMAFPQAVQDCDEAIKRDPKFVKAYLRKAQALFAMKEYNRCLDVCAEAAEHDETGANMRNIEQQQQRALEAQYSARAGETEQQTAERIQRDPDIMAILQDPVMQSILQQAKNDPAALQEHMKNASVRMKIQKLIAAGVIRLGR